MNAAFASSTPAAYATIFPNTLVLGGSLFNNANAITLTQMPDIIGKVAYEPTLLDRTIHMEAFGIFRGNPFFINTGCNIEDLGGAAGAGGGGFACTDNIYKGPFGRLAGGLQYSFTQKYDFGGIGGSQERNVNQFLTSLRYYPF